MSKYFSLIFISMFIFLLGVESAAAEEVYCPLYSYQLVSLMYNFCNKLNTGDETPLSFESNNVKFLLKQDNIKCLIAPHKYGDDWKIFPKKEISDGKINCTYYPYVGNIQVEQKIVQE